MARPNRHRNPIRLARHPRRKPNRKPMSIRSTPSRCSPDLKYADRLGRRRGDRRAGPGRGWTLFFVPRGGIRSSWGIGTRSELSRPDPTAGSARIFRPGMRQSIWSTLPTEGRKVTGRVEKTSIEVPRKVNLEWESVFQPDEVRSVARAEGKSGRFRLTAGNRKSATIDAPWGVEPAIEQGKLVIRVGLSEPKSAEIGELTGQVLDEQGRPVAGRGSGWASPGTYEREPRRALATHGIGRRAIRRAGFT